MKDIYIKLYDEIFDDLIESGMDEKTASDLAGERAYEQLGEYLADIEDSKKIDRANSLIQVSQTL